MQQLDQQILSQSLHFALTPLFAAFQGVTLFAVILAECFVSFRTLERNTINTLISRQHWGHTLRSLSQSIWYIATRIDLIQCSNTHTHIYGYRSTCSKGAGEYVMSNVFCLASVIVHELRFTVLAHNNSPEDAILQQWRVYKLIVCH